jgi:hypothetical protein
MLVKGPVERAGERLESILERRALPNGNLDDDGQAGAKHVAAA